MCGRFTQHHSEEELIKRFEIEELKELADEFVLQERFNIAPSQQLPVVVEADGQRVLEGMKWGLVPFWAKDTKIGYSMINARCETVAQKPSFRAAFKRRRCLIPADGFYEWQRDGKTKTPFHFRMKDDRIFAFAGLWEEWNSHDTGEILHSCTIITTRANSVVEPVHERMPVILKPEWEEAWLDTELDDTDELKQMLKPFAADEMEAVQVSTDVNSPKNQGAGLIETV